MPYFPYLAEDSNLLEITATHLLERKGRSYAQASK
mgnify:CR=1 FL=1